MHYLFVAHLLTAQFLQWDERAGVQILENRQEIRVFYEIQHIMWQRFGLATLPPYRDPIEQGLIIIRPGQEPMCRLLKIVPDNPRFPESKLRLGPINSLFVFDGAFYLGVDPDPLWDEPLHFYVLKDDRFVQVTDEVDRKIRGKLGIGPGPGKVLDRSQLNRLTERSGWRYVPSNDEWGTISDPSMWFEPLCSKFHPVTFTPVEDEKLPRGGDIVTGLRVVVERDGEKTEYVIARVKKSRRKHR